MIPFHPRLRQALLNDPAHCKSGLTENLLLEYESLVTQLHYVMNYPSLTSQRSNHETSDSAQSIQQEIVKALEEFRSNYIPNFDRIHSEWVRDQQEKIKSRYSIDLSPIRLIKKIFLQLKQGKIILKSVDTIDTFNFGCASGIACGVMVLVNTLIAGFSGKSLVNLIIPHSTSLFSEILSGFSFGATGGFILGIISGIIYNRMVRKRVLNRKKFEEVDFF